MPSTSSTERSEPAACHFWVGGKFGQGEMTLHVDNTQTGDHMLDLDVATDAARRMGEACLDVLRRIAPSDVSDV